MKLPRDVVRAVEKRGGRVVRVMAGGKHPKALIAWDTGEVMLTTVPSRSKGGRMLANFASQIHKRRGAKEDP